MENVKKLNESEEKALEGVANNEMAMSAIRKIFSSKISDNFDLKKDNQDLGADLRASITASKLLKEGLNIIIQYGKKKQDKNKGGNPAV